MTSFNLNSLVRSTIRLRGLDAYGNILWEDRGHNTLTYAAAGVFMNAFLRSGPSQVTHLYARFGTDAVPGFLPLAPDNLVAATRADFLHITPGDTQTGGLWVPILASPMQETGNGDLYSGNKVTFYFRIPNRFEAGQVVPAENLSLENSKIFAIGLAVATDSSDREQDVVITAAPGYGYDAGNNVLGEFAPFPIPANGQVSVDYEMEFNVAATQAS